MPCSIGRAYEETLGHSVNVYPSATSYPAGAYASQSHDSNGGGGRGPHESDLPGGNNGGGSGGIGTGGQIGGSNNRPSATSPLGAAQQTHNVAVKLGMSAAGVVAVGLGGALLL